MPLIIVFSLLVTVIMPIILSLFGVALETSDKSPLYIICVLSSNALTIGYVLFKELLNYKRATGPIWPYFIPLLFLSFYLLEQPLTSLTGAELAKDAFQTYIAYSVGGLYAGIYCYRYNKVAVIIDALEILSIICAVALVLQIPAIIGQAVTYMLIGGGAYQNISYTASISFGIIYLSLYRDNNTVIHKLLPTKIYKFTAIILCLLLGVICIIGGGRGGIVLFIVNFVAITYFVNKGNFWRVLSTIVFIFLALWILTLFSNSIINDYVEKGFERGFAFIGEGGIDMEKGSSGRDIVYGKSLEMISENPFVGYGIFRQNEVCMENFDQPYSHNLFIEVTLQRGFLFLIALIVIVIQFIKRYLYLIKHNQNLLYIMPIITYPFVMLEFSGTYLYTSSFWFSLTLVFGYYNNYKLKSTNSKQAYFNGKALYDI